MGCTAKRPLMGALGLAALAGLLVASSPQGWAGARTLDGEYESARTPDDEFIRLTLRPDGKAMIVAENNFQIPGDAAKRRGRTTSYGKWTRKGETVTVRYSKVTDRLKFDTATPLARIGLPGTAPALSPVGKADARSRLGTATLWRLPHSYRLPEQPAAPSPPSAAKPR